MTLEALRCALLGVSAYRNILEEPLMAEVTGLLEAMVRQRGTEAVERYAKIFYRLRQEGCLGLGDWLHDRLRYEEAPYPLALDQGGADPALETAARRDIETFYLLSELDCDKLIDKLKSLLPPDFLSLIHI